MTEILRTYPATTTPTRTELIGKKHVIVHSLPENTELIYVALSYQYTGEGRRETDFDILDAGELKFYSAPKGKKIHYIWYYSSSGTQNLRIYASDGAIRWESREARKPCIRKYEDLAVGNNKEFIVPPNKLWKLLYAFLEATSSATAGDRRPAIEIDDGANPLFIGITNSTFPTGYTRYVNYIQGLGKSELPVWVWDEAIPKDCYLKEGYRVRVRDYNNIDASGDTFQVKLMVEEMLVG